MWRTTESLDLWPAISSFTMREESALRQEIVSRGVCSIGGVIAIGLLARGCGKFCSENLTSICGGKVR